MVGFIVDLSFSFRYFLHPPVGATSAVLAFVLSWAKKSASGADMHGAQWSRGVKRAESHVMFMCCSDSVQHINIVFLHFTRSNSFSYWSHFRCTAPLTDGVTIPWPRLGVSAIGTCWGRPRVSNFVRGPTPKLTETDGIRSCFVVKHCLGCLGCLGLDMNVRNVGP